MEPSELAKRLAAIENRLSRVENILMPPVPVPPEPVSPPPPPPPSYTPVPTANVSAQYTMEEKPGNWLGIAAVICFVLAAGFIIKLSIDSGWLTPARQLGITTLFGLSLVVAGLTLMKTDREYASLLPGAGIIVLYATAFAAHSYYMLISFQAAVISTSIISGFCIWLYTRIGHDAYPITAAIGSYIAPVILGLGDDQVFALYYFLFCSLAFAVLSVGVQSRLLTMISAYLAILMTAYIGTSLHNDVLVASMLALHFLIFASGTYAYTMHNRTALTSDEATQFLPVLLIFYAAEYYFVSRFSPGFAPLISLAFAGLLVGFYLTAKAYAPDEVGGSQFLITSFVTVVCFHSIYIELLPHSMRPWLLVFALFAVAFYSGSTTVSVKKLSSDFPLPTLAVGIIVAVEYLEILGRLASDYESSPLLVAFAALAGLWTVMVRGKQDEFGWLLLGSAHILALFGLYRLTYDFNSLAVSASWLIYAVGVIAFAFARHDEDMAKSALLILSIAAGKALIYDVSSAPPVVRILCLLLTGIVLYISGMIMRRITAWKQ